jgi:DNA-binding NtrC family response regulator
VAPARGSAMTTTTGKHILIAEQPEQCTFANFLKAAGYEVHFCASGDEALALLGDPDSPIDAAIINWEKGSHGGGSYLIPLLRTKRPGLPVVVLYNRIEPKAGWTAKKLGGVVLDKPFKNEELLEVVHYALFKHVSPTELAEIEKHALIGDSVAWRDVLENTLTVVNSWKAPKSADVDRQQTIHGRQAMRIALISGPEGAGKEAIAELFRRRLTPDEQSWKVNLAALPTELSLDALYGHAKGAFTHAHANQTGLIERASHALLILNEIGDIPHTLQKSLLHFLDGEPITRVGGDRAYTFEGWVLCVTNRNLDEEVRKGTFNKDLHDRIKGTEIRLPPLCQRGDDWKRILLHEVAKRDKGLVVPPQTLEALAHDDDFLKGNVRGVTDAVKYAVGKAQTSGATILRVHHFSARPGATDASMDGNGDVKPSSTGMPRVLPDWMFELELKVAHLELDNQYIFRKLVETECNFEKAANLCGVDQTTLRDRLKKCAPHTKVAEIRRAVEAILHKSAFPLHPALPQKSDSTQDGAQPMTNSLQ